MQYIAASVLEAAREQRQVSVGALKGAIAVVQQPANLKQGISAITQGTQLPCPVIYTGSADIEEAGTFNNAFLVVQSAAQIEDDLLRSHTPACLAAVIEGVCGNFQQALGEKTTGAII